MVLYRCRVNMLCRHCKIKLSVTIWFRILNCQWEESLSYSIPRVSNLKYGFNWQRVALVCCHIVILELWVTCDDTFIGRIARCCCITFSTAETWQQTVGTRCKSKLYFKLESWRSEPENSRNVIFVLYYSFYPFFKMTERDNLFP